MVHGLCPGVMSETIKCFVEDGVERAGNYANEGVYSD